MARVYGSRVQPRIEASALRERTILLERIDYARSNAQTIFVKTATRAIIFVGSVVYIDLLVTFTLCIELLARDL